MNDQTAALITELANKLGTTAERLWMVLVKQAPISAFCDLLFLVFALTSMALLFRFIKLKTTPHLDSNGYKKRDFDSDESLMAWLGFGALSAITTAICCYLLPLIIAGFFNPEYWALRQILN